MASPKFRPFFTGWVIFAVAVSNLPAEGWESTVSPFTPGSFAEPRTVRVQYSFAWNGLSAATADLHFTNSNDNRFRLQGASASAGLVRALWKFDGKHTSITDAQTLRPIQVREVESARSKTWETEVNFTPEGAVSRREERRGSAVKTKTRRFDFPSVLSLNSALLFLRSQSLTDGSIQRIVVYPATSAYLCTLTVLGRERLTVPTGNYEAIKLDLQLNKIGKKRELLPHRKFKRATVWISNDADRLVLRIEAEVFIGTVYAELQAVQFENATP